MLRAALSELPISSKLRTGLPRIDYIDSYAIALEHPEKSLTELYAAALGHLPKAFKHLLVLRSILVKPFGIAGVSHRDLTAPIDTTKSYGSMAHSAVTG